jgi:cytochrome P450
MRLTLEKIHARLDKILQDIINEHRSKKEMAAKTGADEEEHDLVDVLLGIQDQGDTEFSLTDNNIKAIILVSMFSNFK